MKEKIEILECKIESKRSTQIPATFAYPRGKAAFPLILAAHGFQSSRHEYGAYTKIAEKLAEHGMGVMCFDFPGNGDSTEPMSAYTLTNNLDDMDRALKYVQENWEIEKGKVGLLGWSMGGCMAALFSIRHPEIQTMALWAPALCNTDIIQLIAGKEGYLKDFEDAIKFGSCRIELDWCTCELSREYFLEMLCCNPFEVISQYKGDLFVAVGMQDKVIDAEKVRLAVAGAVNAKKVTTCYFENGDHDLGTAYGKGEGDPKIMQKLLDDTISFFDRAFGNWN